MYEALHQAALLPLVVVLLFGRGLEVEHVLVAAAFAVSWVGDSVAHFTGGSFLPSYFWLPAQFAFALTAFPPPDIPRLLWGALVTLSAALIALVSWSLTSPGPDRLLTLTGSIAVIATARGALRLPLFLYFGLGSVCYLLMVEGINADPLPAWTLYQGARVAAFLAFIAIVVIQRRRGV